MNVTQSDIEGILARFYRRAEVASKVGISHKDKVEGVIVPDGWVLDPEIAYWLPPNVKLL